MATLAKTFQFSPFQKEIAAEVNVNFDDICLFVNTWDGWQADSTTWTRTGNYTFTVPTDLTARYQKGTKIRYKDGGAFEYGIVQSSSYSAPTTTVTLVTNTDYAMAAATITDNEYSYAASPQGFPVVFNWTPTWTGNGTLTYTSVTGTFKFWIAGTALMVMVSASGTVGGAGTEIRFSLPVASVNTTDAQQASAFHGYDGGHFIGFSYSRDSGANIGCGKITANWTAGAGALVRCQIAVQI